MHHKNHVNPKMMSLHLLIGTLLEQQAALGVEEEDTEGTVQQSLVNECH